MKEIRAQGVQLADILKELKEVGNKVITAEIHADGSGMYNFYCTYQEPEKKKKKSDDGD